MHTAYFVVFFDRATDRPVRCGIFSERTPSVMGGLYTECLEEHGSRVSFARAHRRLRAKVTRAPKYARLMPLMDPLPF